MTYSDELLIMPLFTTLPDIEEAQHISLPDQTAMSSGESCSEYEKSSYDPL